MGLETLIPLITSIHPLGIVGVLLGYLIIQNRLGLFEKIHDLRKEYLNRTFNYVDDVITQIIHKSYDGMCDKLGTKHGNEIEQEKLIYLLFLENIFYIKIKSDVEQSILVNGYHNFDAHRLDDYCTEKSELIYDTVMSSLKMKTPLIPHVAKYVGENFTKPDAKHAYVAIIQNSLSNETARDAKIKKMKRESMLLIGKLFKFIK